MTTTRWAEPRRRSCDVIYTSSSSKEVAQAAKKTRKYKTEKQRRPRLQDQCVGQTRSMWTNSLALFDPPFEVELNFPVQLRDPTPPLGRSSIRKRAKLVYGLQFKSEQNAGELQQSYRQRPAVAVEDQVGGISNDHASESSKLIKHIHLVDVINQIEFEEKDRNRLHGLVSCAEDFKSGRNMHSRCIDIKSLGHGSWNCAYQLTFDDGDKIAALVSNYEPKAFSRTMKESEIATMQYLHSNPKYNRHIKVPEVYTWDLTHTNKAGAPYILREVIEGKDLSKDFKNLTQAQQLKVTTAIARVHKVLSQPAEFNSIGGIYGSPEKGFNTGGYPANWSGTRAYSDIGNLWREKLESGISCNGEQCLSSNQERLKTLVDKFLPPQSLNTLCIQHFDLAIRNVVFNDNFEITGVIDWEYAQVVPLGVAAKIPLDFIGSPELAEAYVSAFADPAMGTSSRCFEDSIDYIHFHDLIMGPDHATAKKYVSAWIEALDVFFGSQREIHGSVLRMPRELRELRRLEGDEDDLARIESS